MILNDRAIANLRNRLVDPFVEDNVQPASIDLRLGNEFMVFEPHAVRVIDLHDPSTFIPTKKVTVTDEFIIHTHEFVLAATYERIMLPDNVAGRLEGKSSLARHGLIIHATGGFIDPGFHGPITLEMTNLAPAPIILRPGDLICQVSFQMLIEAAEVPYNGRYQNAEGVEASKYGIEKLMSSGPDGSGANTVPILNPNHPAMGNLSEEEFNESGYDGPMVR